MTAHGPETVRKVSLWAELPSPMKTDFRESFYAYAGNVYRKEKQILNAYVPAAMGACMPEEDYLIRMRPEELPDVYLCMSYGECSSAAFISRFLNSGIYETPQAWCFFPELIVADLKQLEKRGVSCPESYDDLACPAYRDLVCLIGSGGLPDPMLPIYMYHRHGREGVKALCRNIRTVAGPSSTIRYIGKEQNPYGAVCVMPALFAGICRKQNVRVILPESGALAEPVIYMKKAGEENTTSRIEAFLFSGRGMQTASSRRMTPADGHGGAIPIDRFCRTHLLYPELETVAAMLKMYLADKG